MPPSCSLVWKRTWARSGLSLEHQGEQLGFPDQQAGCRVWSWKPRPFLSTALCSGALSERRGLACLPAGTSRLLQAPSRVSQARRGPWQIGQHMPRVWGQAAAPRRNAAGTARSLRVAGEIGARSSSEPPAGGKLLFRLGGGQMLTKVKGLGSQRLPGSHACSAGAAQTREPAMLGCPFPAS